MGKTQENKNWKTWNILFSGWKSEDIYKNNYENLTAIRHETNKNKQLSKTRKAYVECTPSGHMDDFIEINIS